MEEETVVETPPWEAFKPANSGPWQDFAAPSGPWADFQSAPVDRAMRKADLQAQQAAARSELLPRLAGQLVEPSSPAGIYRDMEQGFAPTRPNTLEQFSQPLANPLNAQTVARGLDVLAGAAEFARQGAVNPNASTAMDERLARDVQPGVGSQIAAGVQQAAAGLSSPAGAGLMAATAGVGALPRLAQRGVSAGFAAWMAANAGTNAGELVNAFEADDVEGFARAATSLGMDATFATLSGLHAVKGIAGDRVPTGNTRPDGTPETRPAAYAQAVNRWLTGQVEKNFTPEQVRDMYRRVNTGEATAQEQELVRVINRQIESPGQALRQGVDVTTPGQSLVSPWLRDFLALTQGEPGVRLAPRQRPANGQQPPVDPAAAPPSPSAGQGERAGVRGLLADRAQPSPPETVPPEAVVPSTATPAPAGTPLPPPLAPNPAPISSSLRTRPEATMETRPTAPLGLQREPTVSPELADTIQALRQGYQQQLDVPAETSNVQRPTTIPDLPTFVAQAIAKEMAPDVNVELVRRRFGAAEAAAAKSSKPTAAEAEMIARAKARAEQQGWAWSEVLRKVQQQLGLDDDFLPEGGNDAIQLAAMRKQDALDAARAQRFDASLASLPTTPAPKTPPDQSGAPTELTPPAKVEAEATIEIGDTALYVDPSRPNKPPVKVAISSIRQLPNDAEMMAEFNYFGPKRVPVSKLKLHDKSQAFKMREMAKRNKAADAATRAQPTPPDQSGAPTAKPSTPAAGQAAPAPPAKAEKIPWRVRVSKDEVFVESDGGRVSRFGWAKVFKSGDQWKAQVFSDQGKALHFVAETDSKAKATKAAKEWAQRQIKTDLLDEATEWIKDVVILKRPPKNSDEAWVSFRKNMMADTRGTAVVDEATFKELWDLFATRIAEVRAAAHPKPTPPNQSGGPTELTPPAKVEAQPETSNVQRPTSNAAQPTFTANVYRGISDKTPNDPGIYAEGTHYTTSKDYADTYGRLRGGKTIEARVELKRPFVTTPEGMVRWHMEQGFGLSNAAARTRVRLEELGYDGVVIRHPDNVAAEIAAGVPQHLLSPQFGDEVIVFQRQSAAPTAPAPKTPPDQSGGPTELTPPAKAKAPKDAAPSAVDSAIAATDPFPKEWALEQRGYRAEKLSGGVHVVTYLITHRRKDVGLVMFENKGDHYVTRDMKVDAAHRGKGLAQQIVSRFSRLGFQVRSTTHTSPSAAKMWQRLGAAKEGDRYVLRPPPDQSGGPTELTPPAKAMEQGFRNMAARQVEARRVFVENAVDQFGVTPAQAEAALDHYIKRKWAKLDAVNGRYDLKAGNLWEAEAIRQAAAQAKPAAQPGVAPTGAEPPAQPGGGQPTLAQGAAVGKVKKVRLGKSLAARFAAETERVGDDILAFIYEGGGMLSKAGAKAKGLERWKLIAPEYDDARPLALPWHNLIYRGQRTPDKVAQVAYEAGKLAEPSVPQLWQAISDASRRRRNSAGTASREEAFMQEETAALERWTKATESGKFAVTNEQLGVGDVLDVEGVRVEVTERNPETGRLTLQDGREFETQYLDDGQTIYVEAWVEKTPEGQPVVDDWDQPAANDFALNAPESVEEQKARLAQEQAQRDAQAQRDRLAELQAKPLTGTTGDLGQGSLLDAPQDLFAPPSPGGGSANASVGDFRAPVPARPAPVPEVPAGAGFADSGLFVDGVEVRLGGSGAVNPVLMPEVYRIYNALTGGDSPFLRRYRSANGMFYAAGAGRIGLHPDLFKFPHQAAYTFAHEVGHLGDYLPDRTLDRGNIFGSIGTLRHWLTTTFPLNPSTPLDDVLKGPERKKLYSRAYNETKRALGPRPNKEESEVDWAVWGEELSKRYQEMVEEVIDERGLIPLKQVRDELLTLTQWWKPYDPATAPESYRKYRESARELYADALSVLFNSPGHLEQMAPTFYKMFWAWLDTKPEFKAALARTQELLAKGDAEVLRARVADDRADFDKGRAAFEAAHAEQERTFTDVRAITARLMRQLVDRGEALTELSEGPRLGGVLPQGMDPREAWEQMLMADNLIYQFSSAVAERVVKPLQDAGLNADTDIGVYLKHTRIQGNKSAREELDLIKARLGRATYTQAEKFADLMEELVRKGMAETQMIDRVILPAEAAGIEFDDITEISRLRLEQGTRVDIANPRLVQAAESERTLAQYLADLGPAKAKALEQAAAAFRDIVFNLVEQGHAAQVFTDRQLQTAQANRHTYAAFRPLDHVDTWVSWTMRRAKGSAKPIENPFVTTMLKMQGLAQAIMENRAKLATRDAMQPVAPESFVKAETYWTGRGQQAKPPAKDMARLIVREQGKPVAYDVDPAIAEAFEKLTPFEQDTAAAWVNWLFHKTLYRGYVSWSLPFNFWTNPNRDIRRTYLNLGAVFGKRAPSMTDLARAYKDAWADAKAYVAGELTPLSREAMEFYAIYAPTDAFYSQFPQDDPSHAIFVKLGLVAEPASKARAMADKVPVLKQALAVGDWVTQQGQQREAVGKLGTWLALRRAGFEPEQAAPFVRNYAGTPNTKVSGSGSAVPNAIFPFYRIWMQALRNWAKLVRNPKTRGGWMFRWAITAGTLRALLGLAGLGYFGKELKDWIDGVPEYDRTRGVPVPVPPLALPGGDYGKKSLYLRLPDDEFSALMGYSLDNAMRAAFGQKGAGQAASDAAAQWLTSAPALNTFADLTAQWLAYAGNGVPEDRFRNRPVLTEPERKAGGAQAFGKMVVFSLDKAGAPMLRQPASEPGSDAEQVLRFTPLLKDMFKVSDAGFREKDMAQRDAVEQVKYAIRMDYGDDTKYLLHRHAVLDRAGTTRTLAQEAEYAFLKRWHADYNRLDAAIVAAQQQNERGEAKERIRDLETASTAYKTAMEQAKAERERPAGPRAVPWSPRLTNAVPARR